MASSLASWKLARLTELGEVNRGRSRHRPRYAEELYGGPYPFIQTGDVKASGGRITSFQQTYSEAGLAQSRLWPAGTLCITIAANIAETGILTFPACFPDSVVGFIANESICDVRFVEYLFRSLKRDIQHKATGSVQDNINLETLGRLEFSIPGLEEQRAIASILGALDDKIELNRKMSATLEAIARALFKSWFVDFDPVRAKAEGRDPGLPTEIAAMFPKSFENSELGEIPNGWKVRRVADLCSTQYGYTAKSSTEDVGPKFLRVMDINKKDWIDWQNVPFCAASPGIREAYGLKFGDIVVARMADPGKSAIIDEDVDAIFASYLVRLKATTLYESYYIYYFLKSTAYTSYVAGAKSGSVQANMNARVIVAADIIVPPEPLLSIFFDQVIPLRKRIASAIKESQTITELRDSILPKLISGEVRVGDAERILAATP